MRNTLTTLICALALVGMGEELELKKNTPEDPYRMNPCMVADEQIEPNILMDEMKDGTDLFTFINPDETDWI
jgi:hypothetical protein